MTKSNLEPDLVMIDGNKRVEGKATSRWKRAAIAFVLSVLVPGLGQVYCKRVWRGLVIALSITAFEFVGGKFRILFSFAGMTSFLLTGILLRLWIAGDACYLTMRRHDQVGKGEMRLLRLLVGAVVFLLAGYPTPKYVEKGYSHFHAFRVPSSSMCPTICEGDRIVAEIDAYRKTAPQPGDLIMLDFQGKHGPLFIKRIVAVGGDVVSERDGVVLINGKAFAGGAPSEVCGSRNATALPPSEGSPRFESVTVPPASFFVVGDNSPNSYDSRIPGFGFVTLDQIKGKPVYIYWSQDRSRIGCPVR